MKSFNVIDITILHWLTICIHLSKCTQPRWSCSALSANTGWYRGFADTIRWAAFEFWIAGRIVGASHEVVHAAGLEDTSGRFGGVMVGLMSGIFRKPFSFFFDDEIGLVCTSGIGIVGSTVDDG